MTKRRYAYYEMSEDVHRKFMKCLIDKYGTENLTQELFEAELVNAVKMYMEDFK